MCSYYVIDEAIQLVRLPHVIHVGSPAFISSFHYQISLVSVSQIKLNTAHDEN